MLTFVPDLSIIATFVVAALVLAITPGPDMALQISRTINYGRAHGYASAAGAMTGSVVHTSLAALGISLLIIAAPVAFTALKLAGAFYLVWLAYQAVFHGGGLHLAAKARRAPTLRDSYLTGVAINLLNPKVVLFFVTFLPQFVDSHDPNAPGKLFFLGAAFVIVSIPLAILTVICARWLAGAFVRSRWVERALNYSFAAIFMGFAATILLAEGKR